MDIKSPLFLTIDDFPSKKSGELVDFLSQQSIPAILFCIGKELEKQEDMGVRALQQGFILGNHAYSHKPFSELSLATAYREINKTDLILERVYAKANVNWENKYFRFPYGDKGDGNKGRIFTVSNDSRQRLKKRNIQKRLAELAYKNLSVPTVTYAYFANFLAKERDISWTLDTMDWCLNHKNGLFGLKSRDDLLARLFSSNPFDCRGTVQERNYGLLYKPSAEIVLMHDHEKLIDTVKFILSELIRKGYSFGKFT